MDLITELRLVCGGRPCLKAVGEIERLNAELKFVKIRLNTVEVDRARLAKERDALKRLLAEALTGIQNNARNMHHLTRSAFADCACLACRINAALAAGEEK